MGGHAWLECCVSEHDFVLEGAGGSLRQLLGVDICDSYARIDSTTCIRHQGRLLRSTLTDRQQNSMMSPARKAGASGGARVGGTR
jgi:hypothetical protein